MARCESLDLMRKKVLENKAIKMEPSTDSDSESDITYMLDLDMSGAVNDNSPGSPESIHSDKEEQAISRPVLSLQCLHYDTDEEPSSSKSDDESTSKFIDVNEVPELSLKCLDKDDLQGNKHEPEVGSKAEEHPNLEPVSKKVSTVICIPLHLPVQTPNIPARGNWDGVHNFKIKVDCSNLPKKSENPVYSESRNKLYVCKDNPFKVVVTAENVPVESLLRVYAVFSKPEHSYDILRRCPTHAQQDYTRGNIAYEHFVQCVSDAAVYEKNTKTGRLSVTVPYEKPQDGEVCTTYLLKLTCFNSCSGGINRRPFTLVFTLEKNNIPLGRQIIEAKVCACPTRDSKTDNEREEKKRSKLEKDKNQPRLDEGKFKFVDNNDSHEPSQSSSSEEPKYSITVKDRDVFEFLKYMKVLYETGVHKISPDT